MATPLFILGKQRSGTTWLANQLCEHSLVAGVRHVHHGGIHESAYFSHVAGRYGSLERKTNYVEFVEAMVVSDTMRILGIDKDFLYSLWPTDYTTVFRAVMDKYAESCKSRYWLDKTPEHTLLVEKIAEAYPDAKFIAVIRNVQDVLSSDIGRQNDGVVRRRELRLARGVLSWSRHNKAIERFARNADCIFVTHYEKLRSNTEQVYRQMCDFLELEFEPAMLQQAYASNTTFRPGRNRNKMLSSSDRKLIDAVAKLSSLVPLSVLDALAGDHSAKVFRKNLPFWFFSMYPPVYEELDKPRQNRS